MILSVTLMLFRCVSVLKQEGDNLQTLTVTFIYQYTRCPRANVDYTGRYSLILTIAYRPYTKLASDIRALIRLRSS